MGERRERREKKALEVQGARSKHDPSTADSHRRQASRPTKKVKGTTYSTVQ